MTAVLDRDPKTELPAPKQKRRLPPSGLNSVPAVVLAVIAGALLIVVSDDAVRANATYFFAAPGDTLAAAWNAVSAAYAALFEGSVLDFHNDGSLTGVLQPITGTLTAAAPLICAGLGICLAFRSGLFNIGAQGQTIAGAMAAGYVGFAWSLPPVVHLLVALIAGMAGGALWGFIAGYLKARTGANEVITTIMLNYVALNVLHYFLTLSGVVAGPGSQASKVVHDTSRLPHLVGTGLPLNLGFVLALAAAVLFGWLLKRSVFGFQLRAMGLNPAAARAAGMNVPMITTLSMTIAGAAAGLAGTVIVLGGSTSNQVTPNVDSNVGFDAITVALLGRNSPKGVVAAGILLGALRQGGAAMQAQTDVPIDIVTVIQALIVIFIAAPRLVAVLTGLRKRLGTTFKGVPSVLTVTAAPDARAGLPRHLVAGCVQMALGVALLLAFGTGARAGEDTTVQFSLPGEALDLGSWTFAAGTAIIVLAVIVVLTGGARLRQWLPPAVATAASLACATAAFIIWSVAGSPTGINITSLLQGTLFPAAIPLILGATAGVIGERAGVVNIAIEGQLLLGAFGAAIGASVSHNIWIGLLAGTLCGVGVAWLLGVLTIRYLVDQVIAGVVLNLLALGLTSFLFLKLMTPHPEQFNTPGYFPRISIPLLSDIPFIGPMLFEGTIFLYATYALVAAAHYTLFHTRFGLRMRAVGEHPRAADTVGVDVNRTRMRALLIGGVFAGLGGVFLVLGSGAAGSFQLNVSAGKGFIALAAVIFGRWTPRGAVLAALLFGFADQLQSLLSLAGSPIDSNLLLTLPYLVTLLAVGGFVGRVRAPAADGKLYAPAD